MSAAGAEFLIVGAHAVMVHTEPRYTKDLDVWVRPTPDNALRVRAALAQFGAPVVDLTVDDLSRPGTIFQIGVAPNRIDILTSIQAVAFDEARDQAISLRYGDVQIRALSLEHLLRNKRAVDRPQDRLDVERLERAQRERV
ncbi:MAG: hypothetical protein JNL79_13385 [Myxococcales bacterium]|nr:hypothetical protein [Myxococcales bacterium]